MRDDLDIFEAEVSHRRSIGSHPRVLVVIAALIGAGVLAAGVVVATTGTLVAVVEAGSSCSTEEPCTDLPVAEVEQRSGLPIAGLDVVSSYRAGGVFGAEFAVPGGTAPDFAASGYGLANEPGVDWQAELAGREVVVIGYYAASGGEGTVTANLLHARNPDNSELILVQVRTQS